MNSAAADVPKVDNGVLEKLSLEDQIPLLAVRSISLWLDSENLLAKPCPVSKCSSRSGRQRRS